MKHAAGERHNGQMVWVCWCECGEIVEIEGYSLRSGNSKSCGCLRRELGAALGKSSKRHGESTHRRNGEKPETVEYRTWSSMLGRCNTPSHTSFKHYGGRGITVCERWLKFENFLADMGRRPSDEHSIERRNNDGNYEPENCYWATIAEQSANQRRVGVHNPPHPITIDGETHLLSEWLRHFSMSWKGWRQRVARGMTEVEALTTPKQSPGRKPRSVPVSS